MKFTKLLAGFSILATTLYLAYQNNAYQTIIISFQQLTGSKEAKPNPDTKQKPEPIHSKAEIDLLIQQQYQKTQAPIPDDEELSESEKLQMVQEALQELDHAEDEYDREVAVMTLGELNSMEAKQGIITALHDESRLVVSQAIRQINKWPNPEDRTEMLLTALQSHNDDIVEQTLLSISVVEDKKLIARLKQLAKHTNRDIREAAQMALNLAP